MKYTAELQAALIKAASNEWEDDPAYLLRNVTHYISVPHGTELTSDRDFEDMLGADELREEDLTSVEQVLLSISYYGLDHLAG